LLSADPCIVADYTSDGAAAALAHVRSLMTHALGDGLHERRPIRSSQEAASLLKVLIGHRCDELLIVLFLDARRCLIDCETIAIGKPDSVDFDQRRIVFRALGRGAGGIIVAHNHPSGDARPSRSDVEVTRRLADLTRSLGIALHDHLVVAGNEVQSAMFSDRSGR
jgi:DNA repair protein RadC